MKPYTPEEIAIIKHLRLTMKPAEIAEIVGRTRRAIDRILSIEKRKGDPYPKLKHGNLKYDRHKADEWREMVRNGMNYRQIQRQQGVNRVIICRVLAAESRNELRW